MQADENCILCGSHDLKIRIKGRDRLARSSLEFSVVECRKCGLAFTSPRLKQDEINEYYPDEYYSFRGDHIVQGKSTLELWVSRQYSRMLWRGLMAGGVSPVRRIKDFFVSVLFLPFYRYRNRCFPYEDRPGRMLDIGCGSGRLLSHLKEQGWAVCGVEFNGDAAGFAREKRGLNVFAGKFENAEYDDDFFDIITMNHALEHLIEPLAQLKRVRKILKPGGMLVVRGPNLSKIESAVFGSLWHAYELPRHMFHFNARSIRRLLMEAGFEVVKVKYTLYMNNIILSMRCILESKKAPVRLIKAFSIENRLLRVIFLLPAFLLKIFGQSSEMLVYARKS